MDPFPMTPWVPTWNNVLERLARHGISLSWKGGSHLAREGRMYPLNLSPNHNPATKLVPPDLRASICRRYKLDLAVLEVDFDEWPPAEG